MKFINKRNLYPIFFLSGILILVLFFSGFTVMEGLTTPVNATTTPAANTNTNTESTTVPIQVSPATAAIVSGALDNIVQMGFSAIKTTNAVVKNLDAVVKDVEATAPTTAPTPAPTPSTTSTSSTNWVPIPTTSTAQ